MNFNKIGIIIKREYFNRVKKKSFILVTFLAPVFFTLMCCLPTLLLFVVSEKAYNIAVIDDSNIVLPYFSNDEAVNFEDYTGRNPEKIKQGLDSLGKDALLQISPLDSVNKTVSVSMYSIDPVGSEMEASIRRDINKAVEDYRIKTSGVEGLGTLIKDVKSNIKMHTYTMTEDGGERLLASGVYVAVSLGLGVLVYMFISLFCGTVMFSVIEEKASRVIEVMVSSVKAVELMFGKIIGVSLVALTQFFLWLFFTGVLIVGATSLAGINLSELSKADPSVQMTEMMGGMEGLENATAQNPGLEGITSMMNPSQNFNIESLGDLGANLDEEDSKEVLAVLSTLANLPYGTLLICFILYFVFGYLLYASLFAAIGSGVEETADAQMLQFPVTIPLLLGFFIAFIAFRNPESGIVFWGSMIPFTSPIVMMARIPFGVPVWEILLSVSLLIATFILCAYVSARIYKVGLLMYGKKPTFKDLWKWFRMN